jgi:hypothetical protein
MISIIYHMQINKHSRAQIHLTYITTFCEKSISFEISKLLNNKSFVLKRKGGISFSEISYGWNAYYGRYCAKVGWLGTCLEYSIIRILTKFSIQYKYVLL